MSEPQNPFLVTKREVPVVLQLSTGKRVSGACLTAEGDGFWAVLDLSTLTRIPLDPPAAK